MILSDNMLKRVDEGAHWTPSLMLPLKRTAQVITFINHILHVGRISVTCIFLQCCGIVGRRHQVLCWVPGEEEELAKLFERLNKASTAYGKEISAEKTKLMTNNISGINREIKVNGQKLETVTSFEYLGSVITVPSQRCSPG